MPEKDYYAILGLDKNASPDEIRQAYKKLSKYYHPDINKSSNANYIFREIKEAYEHLINEDSQDNEDSDSIIYCPKCGKKNHSSSNFCRACGNSLKGYNSPEPDEEDDDDDDSVLEEYNKIVDLCSTAFKAGNYSDLIKYSKKAIEIDPSYYSGWAMLCFGVLGDDENIVNRWQQFQTYYQKTMELMPDDAKKWFIKTVTSILSVHFSNTITNCYNDCVSAISTQAYTVEWLKNTRITIDNTEHILNYIGVYQDPELLLHAMDETSDVLKSITDHIEENWRIIKQQIDHLGTGYGVTEYVMFSIVICNASFLDPHLRLILNANTIKKFNYENKYGRHSRQYLKSNELSNQAKLLSDQQKKLVAYKSKIANMRNNLQ